MSEHKWAIFYQYVSDESVKNQPVMVSEHGNYYLGGNRLQYLIFSRKADAEREASKVRKYKWFKENDGIIRVKRFTLKAYN